MSNQNRVPKGVPTGGQFAETRAGEASFGSLLGGGNGGGGEGTRLREAFDRCLAARDRVRADGTEGGIIAAYNAEAEMSCAVAVDNAENGGANVERLLDEGVISPRRWRSYREMRPYEGTDFGDSPIARDVADVRADADMRRDALRDAKEARDQSPEAEEAYRGALRSYQRSVQMLATFDADEADEHRRDTPVTLHSDILRMSAARLRLSMEEAKLIGVGKNSRQIPASWARDGLAPGGKFERRYFGGGTLGGQRVSVVRSSSSHSVFEDESGEQTRLDWKGVKAYKDDNGFVTLCDEHNYPAVVYRRAD